MLPETTIDKSYGYSRRLKESKCEGTESRRSGDSGRQKAPLIKRLTMKRTFSLATVESIADIAATRGGGRDTPPADPRAPPPRLTPPTSPTRAAALAASFPSVGSYRSCRLYTGPHGYTSLYKQTRTFFISHKYVFTPVDNLIYTCAIDRGHSSPYMIVRQCWAIRPTGRVKHSIFNFSFFLK